MKGILLMGVISPPLYLFIYFFNKSDLMLCVRYFLDTKKT